MNGNGNSESPEVDYGLASLADRQAGAALRSELDLKADNERLKRKVHNQRRELKRLNRKLVVVEAQSRLDQYRRGEADANPFQSRAELRHEFNKMLRRAQAAEAEVERLRKARGDQ